MVPLIDLDRDAHCNCTNVLAPNEDSEEGAKRHGYEDIVGCNSPNQVRSSDGSGTRKPENPTRGFFTNPNPTRTRKKYYKPDPTRTRNIANPTRKPEKTRIYKKYVFLSKYT